MAHVERRGYKSFVHGRDEWWVISYRRNKPEGQHTYHWIGIANEAAARETMREMKEHNAFSGWPCALYHVKPKGFPYEVRGFLGGYGVYDIRTDELMAAYRRHLDASILIDVMQFDPKRAARLIVRRKNEAYWRDYVEPELKRQGARGTSMQRADEFFSGQHKGNRGPSITVSEIDETHYMTGETREETKKRLREMSTRTP